MGFCVLRAVTSLLSACSRRVSSAARRLRGSHNHLHLKKIMPATPFSGGGNRRRDNKKFVAEEKFDGDQESELDDEEVWRRGIIMGGKCQPLDFSGAIYYDVDGRQLALPPVPRSPLRSPLPAFVVADSKAWK